MHQEIEAKFEAPLTLALPDLTGLPGVASVDPPEEFDLEAVYLDAPDLRLGRANITLRRRTGGVDAGWHLKMPVSADERTEFQAPLGLAGYEAPSELATMVRSRVRDAELTPVAILRTRRLVRRLRDAAGRILAEVADDVVTSHAPVSGVQLDSWREWEFELVEGDRALLTAAVELLQAAGASTSRWPSKLARGLGDRLNPEGDAAHELDPRSAGAVLGEYLRGQRDALLTCDPLVRRDEQTGVHRMRVATRRLRSVLATFRPLVERGEAIRTELGWLGGLLGAARDAEVARARLAELLTAEPVELALGQAARRLDEDRATAYRIALGLVLEALDSTRYFRLLDGVDTFVDHPPLTEAASAKATKILPPLVRDDWERLARAVKATRHSPPGSDRDELLHEARKTAKRTRYAGELATLAVGQPAARFALATQNLADLLGQHHDSVELRAVLYRVGRQAHLEGEDTFAYGRLHAIEQARAGQIEEQLPSLWEKAAAGRRLHWLR